MCVPDAEWSCLGSVEVPAQMLFPNLPSAPPSSNYWVFYCPNRCNYPHHHRHLPCQRRPLQTGAKDQTLALMDTAPHPTITPVPLNLPTSASLLANAPYMKFQKSQMLAPNLPLATASCNYLVLYCPAIATITSLSPPPPSKKTLANAL